MIVRRVKPILVPFTWHMKKLSVQTYAKFCPLNFTEISIKKLSDQPDVVSRSPFSFKNAIKFTYLLSLGIPP